MKGIVKNLAVKRCIEAYFTGGDIVWSADGKYIFATCTNVIKAINLDDNLNTYTIGEGDDVGRVTAMCMDNERNRLLVAYNSGLIREYNIPQSPEDKVTVARSWKTMHTAPVLIMKFNNNYTILATGSSDHDVKIWNVKMQMCTHHMKGSSVVTAIAFIRHNRILIGYMEGNVKMCDLTPGCVKKELHEWTNHQSHITAIMEIPDTRKAVIVSRDQTCSIVEQETRETLKTLPLFESIESAVITLNGNMITVGDEGILKEWVIDKAKMIRKKSLVGHGLKTILYNPVRDQLLAISAEENIYVINCKELNIGRQIVGFHDEVFAVSVVGRIKESVGHLAVAANSNQLRLYDMDTWDCKLIDGHTGSVLSVKTAPFNHKLVGSCSKDNTLILWKLVENDNTNTLKPLALGTGHTSSVSALCFSHSAKRQFVLTCSFDTTLKLWNVTEAAKAEPADTPENSLKLSCASTIVAHPKDITCVDCAPNDAICLTSSMDKTVKLWNIDIGKMQLGIAGTLTGHRRGVWDAKFSPNAQKVVTCSGDLTMKIFKVSDRTCLQTFSGHSFAVLKAEWINNATQLISADSGGIIKLWNVDNGDCETSIEAHDDKIWNLTPTSDQSEYITAGSDGRIIVWKDVTEEKKEEEEKERRQKIEEEQTLSNLLGQSRYLDALDYALGLARPYCALKVVNELIQREELLDAMVRLDKSKLQTLLDFATQWNTNSRSANASQQVLHCLLLSMPPEEILQIPNISQTVTAFLPYTKRHMERLNKARQDVALLDFTWAQMRLN